MYMKLITWIKVYYRWGEWIWHACCQCAIPACLEMSVDVRDVWVGEYSMLPMHDNAFNWVKSWSVVKWICVWLGSPRSSHDGVWHPPLMATMPLSPHHQWWSISGH